jgi:hypothetical protein
MRPCCPRSAGPTGLGRPLILVLFACPTTSVAAVSIACVQRRTLECTAWPGARTRFPKPSSSGPIPGTRRRPSAILLQMVPQPGAGLYVGYVWGAPLTGFLTLNHRPAAVLSLESSYIMANLAVFSCYYWNQMRSEFNWILHFVFPVLSTGVPPVSDLEVDSPQLKPFDLAPIINAVWLVPTGSSSSIALRMRGNRGVAQRRQGNRSASRSDPGVKICLGGPGACRGAGQAIGVFSQRRLGRRDRRSSAFGGPYSRAS